jgi:Na+-transporting NADH:ubiquinone oxidoreductase subunit E
MPMTQFDPGTLFFAAIFTNNILLTNFLGLCPYIAISGNLRSAAGLPFSVHYLHHYHCRLCATGRNGR